MNPSAEILADLRKHHPPGSGAPRIEEIPRGAAGVDATVQEIMRQATACAHHPALVRLARDLVRDIPSHDYEAEARAVYAWVKEHVRYTQDPRGLEWIQGPCWTALVQGQGDCDDHAALVLALVLALGHGAAVRTVAGDPARPGSMSHVLPLCSIRVSPTERKWIALDTVARVGFFGWEPPESLPRRDWIISP